MYNKNQIKWTTTVNSTTPKNKKPEKHSDLQDRTTE